MKLMPKFLILTFFVVGIAITDTFAQADTLVTVCTQHLKSPYVSDGQQYQAILNEDESAEFHTTFFGGSTYRVVGCSGLTDKNLVFTLYDRDKNVIFTNATQENAPYWDFSVKSTIDCTIEAKIDNKTSPSGFAILLIGFKQ